MTARRDRRKNDDQINEIGEEPLNLIGSMHDEIEEEQLIREGARVESNCELRRVIGEYNSSLITIQKWKKKTEIGKRKEADRGAVESDSNFENLRLGNKWI